MIRAVQAGGWPAWVVLGLATLAVGVAVAHAARPSRGTLGAAVLAVAITVLAGGFGTVVGLTGSFSAVAHVDPAHKSALLAQGIGESMSCTAIALGATLLWSVPFVLGEVRRRSSRCTGTAPGGRSQPGSP